jgi:putative SOS response-associated peptidase YedK
MCGRISQARDIEDYYRGLGLSESEIRERILPPRRFNVSPGTDVLAIHRLEEQIAADAIRWGYHTKWAKEKKIPPAVNATIEKAKTGYWAGLWKTGRVIVSADGWYEWTGEKGNKQPWFIKPKSGEPIYIAALTGYRPSVEGEQPHGGMALVTTESAGGMLDVHDRRPIVLTPEDAKMWIDLSWSAEQMLELVRASALPPDAFEWYQVTREVNKAGNQSPEMIEPLLA